MQTEKAKMNILRLLPVILSFLLLAAHFSRADMNLMVVVSLIPLVFLFLKKQWVPSLMRILLMLAAVEWLRAMVTYIIARKAAGEPWLRLLFILGGVALFTAASMLVFRNKKLKLYFGSK